MGILVNYPKNKQILRNRFVNNIVIRYFIAADELTWNRLVVARHWE
jgi:hypothetical protein